MSYRIHIHKRRADGSFRWRILWESWTDNVRTQKVLPKDKWPSVGFRTDMSFEEARAFAHSLNGESKLLRQEGRRMAINERLKLESQIECVYLPQVYASAFERDWVTQQDIKTRVTSHWRAAQKMIRAIKLHPHEWAQDPQPLFRYFAEQKLSLSYSEKILRILNEWGIYMARKTSRLYIPIKPATGKTRERIRDAYFDSGKKTKKSQPLAPEELHAAKNKLLVENYNWLFCAIWLGLRPIEVDQLAKTSQLKKQGDLDVLWVYQPKLSALPREERWKLIPILYEEQRLALQLASQVRRPLVKTLEANVKEGITPYCGRKGFHALMTSKGHTFEDISAWLGHRSLDRTWLDYTQRLKVSLSRK